MARRASFGRQPRVQQNLASTLLSIAHEMVARQDSNIMDAWKNGGEYEGKKVTDEMVLAHFQKRGQDLSKDDPLYDTYRDQVLQLQYGIEQSKMDLQHVQNKISDKQYADFFIKWAGKVPQNSDWWRTLQKDAAQLLESAKVKAAANARKQKQDAFNAFVTDQNKTIDLGSALSGAIAQLSKDTNLSTTDNGDRLLALLTNDYHAQPDKYHALTDAIKASGVHFDGTFSTSFFRTSIENTGAAYNKVAIRAHADGYADAYSQATKGQAAMNGVATELSLWPVAKAYDKAFALFSQTWNDSSASAMDKKEAAAAFSATVQGLSQTQGIDTAAITMLQADAARALGQDAGDTASFGASMLGHTTITPQIGQAIAVQANAELVMQQNPLAYKYASVDPKTGNFDPTGQSPVGIVATGAIPADAVFIAIPGRNGMARMVAVQPHDVKVNDPRNPDSNGTVVGSVLSYQVGGQTITLYRYADDQRGSHWTARNPFATGVTGSFDKSQNLILMLPGAAVDPVKQAEAIVAQYKAKGIDVSALIANVTKIANSTDPSVKTQADAYTRDKSGPHGTAGKVIGHITINYTPGKGFTLTQADVTRNSAGAETLSNEVTTPINDSTPASLAAGAVSPSAFVSGHDAPGTFDSPAAASIDAMANHLSGSQVAALAQNPDFQHAFVQQTMGTLGISNPLDPRVAAAWSAATARATQPEAGDNRRGYGRPTDRTDLNYPGAAVTDPTKTTATISFGGNELKLPGLPAYLNDQQGQAPHINLNTPALSFIQQVLGAGGMPVPTPAATQQAPADTRRGYGTVTPTTTVTPTATPAVAVGGPPVAVGSAPGTPGSSGKPDSGWSGYSGGR